MGNLIAMVAEDPAAETDHEAPHGGTNPAMVVVFFFAVAVAIAIALPKKGGD